MPRLTNEEVMKLSHEQLVRYCDWLLTEEGALEILIDAFHPQSVRLGHGRAGNPGPRGPRKLKLRP